MKFHSLLALFASVLVFAACDSKMDDGAASGDTTATLDTSTAATGVELTVYAAASLRESLDELGKAFEGQTGNKVTYNFAGSNELAKQIVAAPGAADVFLSAAENWMDTVEGAKRVVAGSRANLLSNSLVVVASTASDFTMSDPCGLAKLEIKNLALADPEAVPAGKYSKKWMSGVMCDGKSLWDALKDKVAPSPDVRAALGLVLADPKIAGIVYRTDQLAFADKTKVLFEVKDGPPIRYVVAQLNEGKGGESGAAFAKYLSSPEARAVFEKHGFTFTNEMANGKP
ncbi:MAG: molybdate ABC transporter substrate-binding protein [bacterium]|nr:molybdate ABC transporter substrate-binding protein [Candidatus Kapabacteria bacterium]